MIIKLHPLFSKEVSAGLFFDKGRFITQNFLKQYTQPLHNQDAHSRSKKQKFKQKIKQVSDIG
jgi:hypothetical protein